MRMRFLVTIFCVLAFCGGAVANRAVWIPLEGDVDPSMALFLKRAISSAAEVSPDYIIFEVNTFGGRLDAAFDIVDTILGVKGAKTVALVKSKAISAGILISLASGELYMLDGTTIGDCAPIVQNSDGTPQIVGEKIQSPLRAKFRNLAQKNGYPELLSESMVTPELEVVELAKGDSTLVLESKDYERLSGEEKEFWGTPKVLVGQGELLTMTEKEAFALGFSKKTVANRAELETLLGITSSTEIKMSDGEKLAQFLASISGLLLIIGFGALYMEFKTPGFGAFGIIGIIALALVFVGSQAGQIDNLVPLIFLIAGIALFVVEIFVVPGSMIFGLLGIVALVVALALSFDLSTLPQFVQSLDIDTSPMLLGLLYVLLCAIVAMVIPIAFSKWLAPHLPEGYTPIMKGDLADATSPSEAVSEVPVGSVGTAQTFLRPVGHAVFFDRVFDVQTIDSEIVPGDKVEVTRVQDGRIWVRKVEQVNASN